MGILSWILVGLIVGFLAGIVIRGRGYGLAGNIILGVAGGLLGGWLASYFLGIHDLVNGINLTSVIVALAGSILLILIFRLLSGRRKPRKD